MKQFENQLRNNTSSKSDSETIMWKEFLIFVIVGMAGSFVLSCCMPTRMEGVEAISIADTSNGRNCNLWGLFNLAFDFEHMKIKVSGQATIDGQIYDEEILQDFPTGKQYTVVDGHCTVTTLPFTKLFPCIPANATLIKSTYYGSGDHTIGVDWYSFMWEGMDISLAVTTDGCIPITEHINTSNRITDYMLMETTLGIKNMSVFDIPEPCLHCISISPKVQPETILRELDENGFCVVPNVIMSWHCDEYLLDFQKWCANFKEHDKQLHQQKSIIQSYRIGHFTNTWKCRLHCKPIFEKIWGTEKLLTSVDGVALANPPEKGDGEFRQPCKFWLHLDQGVTRQGRHAYQGAIYLEETTEKDHCFRVLKHSHKHHSDFFGTFPKAAAHSRKFEFLKLNTTQRHWYMDNGCALTYVPVPKGGMVIWDSRTVHDTVPPECGRNDIDKWRCVVFVSMTPAWWADDDDIEFKRKVYLDMQMTSHWSSQGQTTLKNYEATKRKVNSEMMDPLSISELPAVAESKEVKQLMGIVKYDYSDTKSKGPRKPLWIS